MGTKGKHSPLFLTLSKRVDDMICGRNSTGPASSADHQIVLNLRSSLTDDSSFYLPYPEFAGMILLLFIVDVLGPHF